MANRPFCTTWIQTFFLNPENFEPQAQEQVPVIALEKKKLQENGKPTSQSGGRNLFRQFVLEALGRINTWPPGCIPPSSFEMTTLSEITSLQQTLNDAINAFKVELAGQHLPEPSLNTSKPHPIDDISYLPTPAMYEARRAALASLVGTGSSLPEICSERMHRDF